MTLVVALACLAVLAGCQGAGQTETRLSLHPASAMVRLGGPSGILTPPAADQYELELARNESEAFQVRVCLEPPPAAPALPVTVQVDPCYNMPLQPAVRVYQVLDLHYTGPADHPQFKVPPRNLGWIPDVCLPTTRATFQAHELASVKPAVTFLFDVHVPAELKVNAPRRFEYLLEFRQAPASPPAVLKLSVLVHPFELPARLPFKTSVAWNWGIEKYLGRKLTEADRLAYLDFFLDQRFTPASFWARQPDFSEAELKRIVARGGNVFQVCGAYGKRPLTDAQKADLEPKLKAWRELMRAAGAGALCYCLIADEPKEEQFPAIRANALWLKGVWPEMKIWLATAPRKELLDVVDVWDVVTAASTAYYEPHRFTPENFALARSAPNRPEYWWFYSVEPYAPHPNARLDDALVDARAIGALSFAQGVDGFEYFWATDWEANAPLRDVPWPAKADKWNCGLAGAGVLCYPGDDGWPIPSLRLFNLRDGFEDWAALRLADEKTGPGMHHGAARACARDPARLAALRHLVYGKLSELWAADKAK